MLLRRSVAAVGRLYPFYSGNFSLVNYSRFAGLFPQNHSLVWCPSPGGPLLVPLNDAVGRCVYYTGDYDRKITWLCRKLLSEGDTAIDVGANLGVVTLAMAKFVGQNGQVHCFEPNPSMQELLSASISKSYKNIRLHRFALGSLDGEMRLYFPPSNVGAGSLVRVDTNYQSIMCRVRTLADVVREEEIRKIRLLKIDVEGFENEVLVGGGDILSSARPLIILETNASLNCPFREYPSIATLIKSDYWFFAIPRALLTMGILEVDPNRIGPPSHDVLAFPRSQYADLKRRLT